MLAHERVRVAVLELIGQIGEEVGDVNRAAHRFPHTHCAVESRLVVAHAPLPSMPGRVQMFSGNLTLLLSSPVYL